MEGEGRLGFGAPCPPALGRLTRTSDDGCGPLASHALVLPWPAHLLAEPSALPAERSRGGVMLGKPRPVLLHGSHCICVPSFSETVWSVEVGRVPVREGRCSRVTGELPGQLTKGWLYGEEVAAGARRPWVFLLPLPGCPHWMKGS